MDENVLFLRAVFDSEGDNWKNHRNNEKCEKYLFPYK